MRANIGRLALTIALLAAPGGLVGAGGPAGKEPSMSQSPSPLPAPRKLATFGGGCFWCVDAMFRELAGVEAVESGYAGGRTESPTYEEVCTGTTGHAEVVQISYDPARVSYEQLLEVFFKTHAPTTKDRQGNDVGPQYRSIILTHDEEQRTIAARVKKDLDAAGAFGAPIVTEIAPYTKFFKGEAYHQDYFRRNPRQPYCTFVIVPKVEKFRKVFKDRLRKAP